MSKNQSDHSKIEALFLNNGRKLTKKQAKKVLDQVMAHYLHIYAGVTPEMLKAIKEDARENGLEDPWLITNPEDN